MTGHPIHGRLISSRRVGVVELREVAAGSSVLPLVKRFVQSGGPRLDRLGWKPTTITRCYPQ
jgi:hypothetical protein